MTSKEIVLPTATHTEFNVLLKNTIELGGVAAAVALIGFIAFSGFKIMTSGGKKK